MKITTLLISLMVCGSVAFGAAFEKKGVVGDLNVVYSSEKPLITGNNTISVSVQKGGVALSGAKVTMKVFMPAMPGMAYMEYQGVAKEVNGVYQTVINLSMGGTWQVRMEIATPDGQKKVFKSSFNL